MLSDICFELISDKRETHKNPLHTSQIIVTKKNTHDTLILLVVCQSEEDTNRAKTTERKRYFGSVQFENVPSETGWRLILFDGIFVENCLKV